MADPTAPYSFDDPDIQNTHDFLMQHVRNTGAKPAGQFISGVPLWSGPPPVSEPADLSSQHRLPMQTPQFAVPESPVSALANALSPRKDPSTGQQTPNPLMQGLVNAFSFGGGSHAQNLGFVPGALFGE